MISRQQRLGFCLGLDRFPSGRHVRDVLHPRLTRTAEGEVGVAEVVGDARQVLSDVLCGDAERLPLVDEVVVAFDDLADRRFVVAVGDRLADTVERGDEFLVHLHRFSRAENPLVERRQSNLQQLRRDATDSDGERCDAGGGTERPTDRVADLTDPVSDPTERRVEHTEVLGCTGSRVAEPSDLAACVLRCLAGPLGLTGGLPRLHLGQVECFR